MGVMRRAIIAFGMMLAWGSGTHGLDPSLDVSQYAHKAWNIRDGFPKDIIHAIAQTPDGYLWLGTETGLFRFDGVGPSLGNNVRISISRRIRFRACLLRVTGRCGSAPGKGLPVGMVANSLCTRTWRKRLSSRSSRIRKVSCGLADSHITRQESFAPFSAAL